MTHLPTVPIQFMKLKQCFFPAVLLALTGCAVGPDFHPSSPVVHEGVFSRPSNNADVRSQTDTEEVDPSWWKLFNDPLLVSLEQRAIAGNFDLRTAALRIEQSRASLAMSRASSLPTVGANASQLRERSSPNGILALTGASSSVAPTAANGGDPFGTSSLPGATGSPPFSVSQYGLDASWELDLWGRARRIRESATAQVEAAQYDAEAMRVSMTAEVARTYLELRGVQSDLRIAIANVDIANKSLHVATRRSQQGVATRFDTSISAAQVATFQAAIPDLEQRRAALMNALALLIALPPHALDQEFASADDVPPLPARVPVGLPSQLAHRRPDILRAEALLHASTAAIGVAKADFYPSISLTGSFGFQSLKFSDVGNWASRQFAVGPVLHLPIFEGGRLTGNLALTEARQQEAAINYQRTVLSAWHEVDNAMTAYRSVQQRAERFEVAATANRQALKSAERRYAQGATDYLNVLVTQQRLLDSETAASRSRTDMTLMMVALYKALGGGWEPGNAAQASAVAPAQATKG